MTGNAAAAGAPGSLRRASNFLGWLRGSRSGLLGAALVVGTGSGLGAVAFRYLIYLHLAGHRTRAVRPARQGRQYSSALAGPRILRRDPGHRGPGVRAADLPVRAGGPRARRPRGDDRGRRGRRPDPASGQRRQGGRLRAVHRRRRVGGPGGPDRADRLRARVQPGPVGPDAGEPDARPGRVRRRRRDFGDVQRPGHRRVLRDRADPAGVLHRGDLHRDAVGDGRRPGQPGVPRRRPVLLRPPIRYRAAPREQLPARRPARGGRGPARAGVQEHPVQDRGHLRPDLGAAPSGRGPPPAGSRWGCCCSRSRRCTASATRSCTKRSAAATPCGS